MGNNSSREGRPTSSAGHPGHPRAGEAPHGSASHSAHASGDRIYSSRSGRGSGPDLSFLGIGPGSSNRDLPEGYTRRETKAEREARKLAKERELREKERERSMREEGVDGGYLVTLGTYTGTEDFNKQIVRQLMIERRIAPFWKGLNDHDDSWAEHQLVAAARGLPIPPADQIPPELENKPSAQASPKASDSNLNGLMVPITTRSPSATSDTSGRLSPGYGGFSLPSSSPAAKTTSSNPFIRTRAKTLAALSTTSKNNSQAEMTPQEIMLPKDPFVNGQTLEAFLYKDASECPICFLYYPPYLNRTRCCDQPICSECFVQIKRPDPHPPEHHDPNDPNSSQEPQDDCMLISEPAACPFCVQPEFGVTYEPPPFRRGLAYQGQLAHPSAMSSSSSLSSPGVSDGEGTRKRGKSLSANSPGVITTDMVRPDWAKKLNDARAHALRRSAAATALHNAAYVIGNNSSESRGFGLGRRRRTLFSGDSPNSSGQGTPRNGSGDPLTQLLSNASSRTAESHENPPGRHSSRRTRMEDLEELMMMEAIRLSLAAEEERKKKEEKEAAKQAKKEEKKKAKEEKKMTKNSRKSGFFPVDVPEDESSQAGPSSQNDFKGKAIDRSGAGFNPLSEPTSTLHTVGSSSARSDPQRHLEESRARIHSSQSSNAPEVTTPPSPQDSQNTASHRTVLRQLSNASSSASSLAESESERDSFRNNGAPGLGSGSSFEPSPNTSGLSLGTGTNSPNDPTFASETPPGGGAGTEPMFNFRSLAAVIGNEEERAKSEGSRRNENTEHIEDVGSLPPAAEEAAPASPTEPMQQTIEDDSPKSLHTVPDVAESSATRDTSSEKEGFSTPDTQQEEPVTPVSTIPPVITTTPASPPENISMAAKTDALEADGGLPQKGCSDVRVDEHSQEGREATQ
ncbi:protein SIP5 [Phyllosticta capitalensis]